MGRKRDLSVDQIYAMSYGKIHPGSTQCCIILEFPASEGTQDILTICIPHFIPFYYNKHFILLFVFRPFLVTSRKKPSQCLILLLCHRFRSCLHFR